MLIDSVNEEIVRVENEESVENRQIMKLHD